MTERDPTGRDAEERFYQRPYLTTSSEPAGRGCWVLAIAALGGLMMIGSGLCASTVLSQADWSVLIVFAGVPFFVGLLLVLLAWAIC